MCFSGFLFFLSVARSTRLCSACSTYLANFNRHTFEETATSMWNTLFMMAILLYDIPAGCCMFVCIDQTCFFTVFLLCALWFHDISTCQSSYLSSLLISVWRREEPSFKKNASLKPGFAQLLAKQHIDRICSFI